MLYLFFKLYLLIYGMPLQCLNYSEKHSKKKPFLHPELITLPVLSGLISSKEV